MINYRNADRLSFALVCVIILIFAVSVAGWIGLLVWPFACVLFRLIQKHLRG